MSRRRQPYVWGCSSNTEPPDDEPDEVGGGDPADGPELDVDHEPDEAAADAACDRWERDRDATASQ